jgi:hypothetical protein
MKRESDDETTQEALRKLTEASDLYDRYDQLAGINTYPSAAELEPAPDYLPAEAERPLGFVLSPSPIGIAIYKRT